MNFKIIAIRDKRKYQADNIFSKDPDRFITCPSGRQHARNKGFALISIPSLNIDPNKKPRQGGAYTLHDFRPGPPGAPEIDDCNQVLKSVQWGIGRAPSPWESGHQLHN
jgi:hypothetical protein